jgi:hypothetical protein
MAFSLRGLSRETSFLLSAFLLSSASFLGRSASWTVKVSKGSAEAPEISIPARDRKAK